MKKLFIGSLLLLAACKGSLDSSSHSSTSQDNSVDNSQTGISSCATGLEIVCRPNGEGGQTIIRTEECRNVNGEPVIVNGPDELDGSELQEACPTPTPTPVPEPGFFIPQS